MERMGSEGNMVTIQPRKKSKINTSKDEEVSSNTSKSTLKSATAKEKLSQLFGQNAVPNSPTPLYGGIGQKQGSMISFKNSITTGTRRLRRLSISNSERSESTYQSVIITHHQDEEEKNKKRERVEKRGKILKYCPWNIWVGIFIFLLGIGAMTIALIINLVAYEHIKMVVGNQERGNVERQQATHLKQQQKYIQIINKAQQNEEILKVIMQIIPENIKVETPIVKLEHQYMKLKINQTHAKEYNNHESSSIIWISNQDSKETDKDSKQTNDKNNKEKNNKESMEVTDNNQEKEIHDVIEEVQYFETIAMIINGTLLLAVIGGTVVTYIYIFSYVLIMRKLNTSLKELIEMNTENVSFIFPIDSSTYETNQIVLQLTVLIEEMKKFMPKYTMKEEEPEESKQVESSVREKQMRFQKSRMSMSVISRVSSMSFRSSTSSKSLNAKMRTAMGLTYRDVTIGYFKWHNIHVVRAKLGAQEMVQLVTDMTDIIEGTIITRKGMPLRLNERDVMGAWNTNMEILAHCSNACRAALDIFNKLKTINAQLQNLYAPPIQFTVGICTGKCHFGIMGSSESKSFQIFGDAVILAESYAIYASQFKTDRSIAISEVTKHTVAANFIVRPLECINVQHPHLDDGTSKDIIYELCEEKSNKHDEWLYEVAREKREKRYEYYDKAFEAYLNESYTAALQLLDEHILHFNKYMETTFKEDDIASLGQMGLMEGEGAEASPTITTYVDHPSQRLKYILENKIPPKNGSIYLKQWSIDENPIETPELTMEIEEIDLSKEAVNELY